MIKVVAAHYPTVFRDQTSKYVTLQSTCTAHAKMRLGASGRFLLSVKKGVVDIAGRRLDFSDWKPTDATLTKMSLSGSPLQCLVLDIDKSQAPQLELLLGGLAHNI